MQLDIKSVINTLREWIEIKSVKSEALDGAPFGIGNKIMLEKFNFLCYTIDRMVIVR